MFALFLPCEKVVVARPTPESDPPLARGSARLAAAHAPIADIVIGVVTAAQPHRDHSITMPGAFQASLRIRPPPLAFLDGAEVPGWLRAEVIILLTLLTFS